MVERIVYVEDSPSRLRVRILPRRSIPMTTATAPIGLFLAMVAAAGATLLISALGHPGAPQDAIDLRTMCAMTVVCGALALASGWSLLREWATEEEIVAGSDGLRLRRFVFGRLRRERVITGEDVQSVAAVQTINAMFGGGLVYGFDTGVRGNVRVRARGRRRSHRFGAYLGFAEARALARKTEQALRRQAD